MVLDLISDAMLNVVGEEADKEAVEGALTDY